MTTKKTTVILPSGWPGGQFRRTMRTTTVDKAGRQIVSVVKDDNGNDRVLNFQAGKAVELSAEELEAVRGDVGPVLHIAKVVDTSKPENIVAKPDSIATKAFVEETAKLRSKEAAKIEKLEAKAAVSPAPSARKDLENK